MGKECFDSNVTHLLKVKSARSNVEASVVWHASDFGNIVIPVCAITFSFADNILLSELTSAVRKGCRALLNAYYNLYNLFLHRSLMRSICSAPMAFAFRKTGSATPNATAHHVATRVGVSPRQRARRRAPTENIHVRMDRAFRKAGCATSSATAHHAVMRTRVPPPMPQVCVSTL